MSDWIPESPEYPALSEYLEKRKSLFNPSVLFLFNSWIDTFYDSDLKTLVPLKELTIENEDTQQQMEVPDKVDDLILLCSLT